MSTNFTTIRAVGGMLPSDLLSRMVAADKDVAGLTPKDYDLPNETPREAANRVWSYLFGVWTAYKANLARLPEGDPAVGLTREKWLLVLFDQLGYGRVAPTPAGGLHIAERAFPVSHLWGQVPLHLLGWGVELDKRTKGVAGAAERAPHAMVQELLNRTDDYLWAIISNGQSLRLLRDSSSLSGQSYVEFDLAAMFDGEVFSDFAVMYLLLHRSRVEILSPNGPASDCWLERWRTTSIESGTRALGLLRDGVQAALEVLGTGFLQHPANSDLRRRLDAKELSLEDYHRSLLRLVYRLLFLFVAEDRQALLIQDADPVAKAHYADYFSTARLRALSRKRRGTRHSDLWEGLSLVITSLGNEEGCPQLGLPGMGGLFDHGPADVVTGQSLPNEALLTAIRNLSVVQPKGQPNMSVDYRNLGAEELGGIYESLLELVPRHDSADQSFSLESLAGNERKTTGSYYTPTSLIDLILDQALDPLLDDAEKSGNPAEALLALTICDPACGSGHFLVSAARRIADRLAVARTGDVDPTPTDQQAAMYDVVANCIYGVDLNPMAAELAKVSLWLEALQPGRPLSFLDAHIKVGNALLGVTPALLGAGVPDAAFKPIEGDDKKWAAALAKRNKAEHQPNSGQGELFGESGLRIAHVQLARAAQPVADAPKLSLADIHAASQRYRVLETSAEVVRARKVADAWCAAFAWQKTSTAPPAVTQKVLEDLDQGKTDLLLNNVSEQVSWFAASYRFFHWHLEFPHLFRVASESSQIADPITGWEGGFSCLLGNPPWLSYSGRQAIPTRAGELALLRMLYPETSAWPSAHGAFFILASRLAERPGGGGLVLPMPIATLQGYSGARQAICDSGISVEVFDQGEDCFPGVSQRVGTFTFSKESKRTARGTFQISSFQRPKRAAEDRSQAQQSPGDAPPPGTSPVHRELLRKLASLPRFPKSSFSDPGVHTGNVSKRIILDSLDCAVTAQVKPVREGKNITAFVCGPPRKWLLVNPDLSDGEYCRIQSESRYQSVPIIVRQTASRPIAARHSEPTYFRNSLLACWGVAGMPDEVTVAILNSTLINFWYRASVLDSSQRVFPQVKVRALRELPICSTEDMSPPHRNLVREIAERVRLLETQPSSDVFHSIQSEIDDLVCSAYDLSTEERDYVRDFAHSDEGGGGK